MMNLKTTVALSMLSIFPSCLAQSPKSQVKAQTYISKTINSQPAKDIFQAKAEKTSSDIVTTISKIVGKEEGLREGVEKFVRKYSDENETKFLMLFADTPEKQIQLAKLINLNSMRKNEKVSVATISELINVEPQEEKTIYKIMLAKQKFGKDKGHFYSSDAVFQMYNEVKSAFSYITGQSIKRMIKKGFPEEGFFEVINAAKGTTNREQVEKAKIVKTALKQNLPATEIVKKLNDLKLPEEIYNFN